MERRIRISALLTAIGLTVSMISLLIAHPLAFVMFLGIGVVLIAIAVIYYLISLVRVSPAEETSGRGGVPGAASGERSG